MRNETKHRSHVAVVAQFRNSAGSMHHKSLARGGAHNEFRDIMAELQDDTCDHATETAVASRD